jgi:putative tryptophan/tyrosine transport system substrate-binding protein
MRRREFITLLGGTAVAWPAGVRAQQQTKIRTIGFLGATEPSTWSKEVTAFERRLHELGWYFCNKIGT